MKQKVDLPIFIWEWDVRGRTKDSANGISSIFSVHKLNGEKKRYQRWNENWNKIIFESAIWRVFLITMFLYADYINIVEMHLLLQIIVGK